MYIYMCFFLNHHLLKYKIITIHKTIMVYQSPIRKLKMEIESYFDDFFTSNLQ